MPAPTLRNQAILFTIYAPSILAMSMSISVQNVLEKSTHSS